jgi:hypothetical protein
MSWADRVKCQEAKVADLENQLRGSESKKVRWKSGELDLGVETRSYIDDEDPEEIKKEWIIVDGQLWDRVGFSQMTTQDGKDLPKNIFGALVSNYIEGTKNERGERENARSPDFFKIGKGKACVERFQFGDERISEIFEEALKKLGDGGKFSIASLHLEKNHLPIITELYRLYREARVEDARLAKEAMMSTLNPSAQVFCPSQILKEGSDVLVRCSARQRLVRQLAVMDDSSDWMKGGLKRVPSW